MENKDRKPTNPVIKDDALARFKQTQQIKVTDENAAKYGAAFTIKTYDVLNKIYGRLGYIIKLLEQKGTDGNPKVLR